MTLNAYRVNCQGKIVSISKLQGRKLLLPIMPQRTLSRLRKRVPSEIEIIDLEKKIRDMLRAGLSLDVSVRL
jgi:hypothetical protein